MISWFTSCFTSCFTFSLVFTSWSRFPVFFPGSPVIERLDLTTTGFINTLIRFLCLIRLCCHNTVLNQETPPFTARLPRCQVRCRGCDASSCPAGGGTGGQQTILHEERWKMPALPALLLSIYVVVPLLTMAPRSLSQPSSLAALRMGEYGHMARKPRPLSLRW